MKDTQSKSKRLGNRGYTVLLRLGRMEGKKRREFLLLVVSRTRESRSTGQYWTTLMVLVVFGRPEHTRKSRLFAPKAPLILI